MWVILALGWLGVLLAGVSLCRVASYADRQVRHLDKKVRTMAARRRQDLAA
jgi:hypothetical protein